jgi:hypothetical protein
MAPLFNKKIWWRFMKSQFANKAMKVAKVAVPIAWASLLTTLPARAAIGDSPVNPKKASFGVEESGKPYFANNYLIKKEGWPLTTILRQPLTDEEDMAATASLKRDLKDFCQNPEENLSKYRDKYSPVKDESLLLRAARKFCTDENSF